MRVEFPHPQLGAKLPWRGRAALDGARPVCLLRTDHRHGSRPGLVRPASRRVSATGTGMPAFGTAARARRSPRARPVSAAPPTRSATSHGYQLGDHLIVGQRFQALKLERAVDHVLGQRAQVDDLRAAEARRNSQRVRIIRKHLRRRRSAAAEALGQAAVDRPRGLRRELLADDRAHEGSVMVIRAPGARVAEAVDSVEVLDHCAQDRICGSQVRDRIAAQGAATPRAAPSRAPKARSTEQDTHVNVGVSRSV